jgi:hypothetical protein
LQDPVAWMEVALLLAAGGESSIDARFTGLGIEDRAGLNRHGLRMRGMLVELLSNFPCNRPAR